MKEKSENSPPSASDLIKALNYQGAFFKKSVLRRLAKVLRVAEEVGARFGQTRVADIVGYDGQGLVLVVECKKVSELKKWVFIKHQEQLYRKSRKIMFTGTPASILDSPPPHPLVCSEGFEVGWSSRLKDFRADQDPIFQAASQLSAAYLGFMQRRLLDFAKDRASSSSGGIYSENFVPVLVTNAELSFVAGDFVVNEKTGEADLSSETTDVPYILLRHPFPQIEGQTDFRDSGADDYQQRYQETIYVVNISGLDAFVSADHRENLRDSEPGMNPRGFL